MDLTDGQRQQLIALLSRGESIPVDYKNLIFPPEKQEYELVYANKEREEDILAETMAIPLQPLRTIGGPDLADNGEWRNRLIFGDNLQVMKTLLREKQEGELINPDGCVGRFGYPFYLSAILT